MKRYLIIFSAAISMTACTKTVKVETTETIEDGKVTTTTTTETDYDLELRRAEENYRAAEAEVELAHERGDLEAEREAKINAAKAKKAWEDTKAGIRKGLDKTGDVLENAAKEIDSAVDKDQDGKIELK